MNIFARYHACMVRSEGYPLEQRHNSKGSIQGSDHSVSGPTGTRACLVTSSDPKSDTSSGTRAASPWPHVGLIAASKPKRVRNPLISSKQQLESADSTRQCERDLMSFCLELPIRRYNYCHSTICYVHRSNKFSIRAVGSVFEVIVK